MEKHGVKMMKPIGEEHPDAINGRFK